MKLYYLPDSWVALVAWLKNFLVEVPGAAARLNEPVADVAAVQADAQAFLDTIATVNLAAENLRKANAAKEDAKKRYGKSIRAFITRIKANPRYTDEIGNFLRILNAVRNENSIIYSKPNLIAKISGGFIRINFTKNGADALRIYSMLPGEADFTRLDTVVRSPYIDPRPPAVKGVAELRQYKAMYIHNNMEVGQWSEVISVSYAG